MAKIEPKKIIIDVDVGSDDAWALKLLIGNELKFNYKVIAITCNFGNTTIDYVARNVMMVLESIDRTDIPVYKGAYESIIRHGEFLVAFHGIDGFGDMESYDITPNLDLIKKEHAVNIMYKHVTENPKQVTIISIGPVTNLALCLKMFPNIRNDIQEIFIMGGNHPDVGNLPNKCEFNFKQDPEAADIVLSAPNCPITIVPWETCVRENFFISLEWFKNLQSNEKNSKFFNFIKKIDLNAYTKYKQDNWNPCDSLLAMSFLHPEVILSEKFFDVALELNDKNTRGQIIKINDKRKEFKKIKIIEKLDAEKFKTIIYNNLND